MTASSHRTGVSLVGDCTTPATHRVEGYSPLDGIKHGSLDAVAYACPDHVTQARTVWLHGFTPWSAMYGRGTLGATCGRLVHFDDEDPS